MRIRAITRQFTQSVKPCSVSYKNVDGRLQIARDPDPETLTMGKINFHGRKAKFCVRTLKISLRSRVINESSLHKLRGLVIANEVDALRNCEASASNAIQVSNSKWNQNQQNSCTFLVSTQPTLISTLTTPIPPIQAVCHSVNQRCFMSRTHREDNLRMRNLRGTSSVVSKEEVQDSC